MKENESGGHTRQGYRKDQHHVDVYHLFQRVLELEEILSKTDGIRDYMDERVSTEEKVAGTVAVHTEVERTPFPPNWATEERYQRAIMLLRQWRIHHENGDHVRLAMMARFTNKFLEEAEK